ncbi:MAG TPA: nucleotidyl transferase AbiEii/AbiGii toxin family protein [Guyparkeria sp.]|nr:nucleotidyl transferase AbiEii/AbiGii toxin family protein [Guyparkeria sp.]
MRLAALDAVAMALDAAQVRYLVAGGLAVNAHGYVRLTMDIDLVIALDAGNIRQAFHALDGIGYRPTVPIDADAFAQPEQRRRWREEKGMQVLNFQSDDYPGTSVDVFVYEPFNFSQEYDIAMQGELLPGINVRFVSIPTLIRMKQAAGRPRDLDDIRHLQWLQENPDE